MNEYEVKVPVVSKEHSRNDYLVKANSPEEAIKVAQKGKAEQVWYKYCGNENEIILWDEARVEKL